MGKIKLLSVSEVAEGPSLPEPTVVTGILDTAQGATLDTLIASLRESFNNVDNAMIVIGAYPLPEDEQVEQAGKGGVRRIYGRAKGIQMGFVASEDETPLRFSATISSKKKESKADSTDGDESDETVDDDDDDAV